MSLPQTEMICSGEKAVKVRTVTMTVVVYTVDRVVILNENE